MQSFEKMTHLTLSASLLCTRIVFSWLPCRSLPLLMAGRSFKIIVIEARRAKSLHPYVGLTPPFTRILILHPNRFSCYTPMEQYSANYWPGRLTRRLILFGFQYRLLVSASFIIPYISTNSWLKEKKRTRPICQLDEVKKESGRHEILLSSWQAT